MILGVVGHEAAKFTTLTKGAALREILAAVIRYGATSICSGRSPLGGVDVWAEDVAAELKMPTLIFEPVNHRWDGPGGFKERNLRIATTSDVVLVVVVRELPVTFNGMRFGTCYHCLGRNPPHVKSGGCWTAWRARAREWRIV